MDLRARVPDRCVGDVLRIAWRRKRSDRSADEARGLGQQDRIGGSDRPSGGGREAETKGAPQELNEEKKKGVP
jgi:hypothetical protein